uniref:Uncharacterized protein n=1 Tax=Eutreptiella gymnastica TaxID=73025 RepID=A0A7S1NS42_9EUGL
MSAQFSGQKGAKKQNRKGKPKPQAEYRSYSDSGPRPGVQAQMYTGDGMDLTLEGDDGDVLELEPVGGINFDVIEGLSLLEEVWQDVMKDSDLEVIPASGTKSTKFDIKKAMEKVLGKQLESTGPPAAAPPPAAAAADAAE